MLPDRCYDRAVAGPDDVHSGTWTARAKGAAETWHVRNCRLEVVRWERAVFLEKQTKPSPIKQQLTVTTAKELRAEPRVSPSTAATAGASRR